MFWDHPSPLFHVSSLFKFRRLERGRRRSDRSLLLLASNRAPFGTVCQVRWQQPLVPSLKCWRILGQLWQWSVRRLWSPNFSDPASSCPCVSCMRDTYRISTAISVRGMLPVSGYFFEVEDHIHNLNFALSTMFPHWGPLCSQRYGPLYPWISYPLFQLSTDQGPPYVPLFLLWVAKKIFLLWGEGREELYTWRLFPLIHGFSYQQVGEVAGVAGSYPPWIPRHAYTLHIMLGLACPLPSAGADCCKAVSTVIKGTSTVC